MSLVETGKIYAWGDDPQSCYQYDLEQIIEHYWVPISRKNASTAHKFYSLASRWAEETSHLSSVSEMSMHPAYQQIIGMGKEAIPLILWELKRIPNHWFWALKSITGEDPVRAEDRGKIAKMSQAWIEWGKEHGYQW